MSACAVVSQFPVSTAVRTRDQDLLERARENDAEAFAELVQRHYLPCLRMAMSMLRNAADAEDEVQNTFLKALVHLPEFERRAELRTWLISIVRNQCLMRVRSAAYRRSTSIEATSPASLSRQWGTPWSAEEAVADEQAKDLLARNVRRLPAIYREVLLMHGLGEMRLETIAERLGITIGAVKSRLRRARTELRTRLNVQIARTAS